MAKTLKHMNVMISTIRAGLLAAPLMFASALAPLPAGAQEPGAATSPPDLETVPAQNTAGQERAETRCLTLAEAERLALEGNRGLLVRRARADAAEARADGSDAFLWPSVGVEAGFTRSDDPVAAFGTRLRQARFAEADFALDALNRPDATEDWTGAVGVQWSAVDPTRWAGRSAARAGARAERLGSVRAADAVRFRTRVFYLEALRADAALEAARSAESAAASTTALMRSRREQGLLTDADVLQAEAALSGARSAVTAAERAVGDARGRLALHLGLPDGVEVVPADTVLELEGSAGVGAFGAPGVDLSTRADVRASLAGVDAAGAAVRQARAARLPTLGAFARLSSHAPDPFDGREANVTLGVQLSVPLFTGGALSSAVEEARALERVARLEHDDRLAAARTELEEARRGVEAARRGAEAAVAGRTAAAEARRLLRRRFEEGMATTAELLQAEARAAEFRTAAVDAVAGWRLAEAFLAFVSLTPDNR